jgi:hypothetical protein
LRGDITCQAPAVNPNVHDTADQAKYAYATGTQALAALQYRLAKFLFDATSGIDALRTVEDDEEEQR